MIFRLDLTAHLPTLVYIVIQYIMHSTADKTQNQVCWFTLKIKSALIMDTIYAEPQHNPDKYLANLAFLVGLEKSYPISADKLAEAE